MLGLWSQTFPYRSSPQLWLETAEISRFSNIECLRMHRVFDSAGPANGSLYNAVSSVAFPFGEQGQHPGWVISELNGWPAFSPVNCFTCRLTATRT